MMAEAARGRRSDRAVGRIMSNGTLQAIAK